ncbi:MAG: tRNA (cytidine(56)-2'-O)-methyltransferase [Promethearchaeota archaeon]
MKVSRWCIIVLRIDHRPERDKRLTTHLGLTARAFGAQGFWITGLRDPNITKSLQQVCSQWGYRAFSVQYKESWRKCIQGWKNKDGEVVHLTMYGLHVDDIIPKIRSSSRDKLVVVGGPKVPSELFTLADYNVAIGHQPHSEVAALAIFLDRLYQGSSLRITPHDAELTIEPTPHGKRARERNT